MSSLLVAIHFDQTISALKQTNIQAKNTYDK